MEQIIKPAQSSGLALAAPVSTSAPSIAIPPKVEVIPSDVKEDMRIADMSHDMGVEPDVFQDMEVANGKPFTALDATKSKLDRSESTIFSPDATEEQKQKSREDWKNAHVELMKHGLMERAADKIPSLEQLKSGSGKIISDASETASKLLPEYVENPAKAAIAGLAQIPRVAAETGRMALNLGANIGEEAMSKFAGDDSWRMASAEVALKRLELNKKFEGAADTYTEKTYGKEKPATAAAAQAVASAAIPFGEGKALKAIGGLTEKAGQAAVIAGKKSISGADKVLKATSAIGESLVPKGFEPKALIALNDFVQKGFQPILEKKIINLVSEFDDTVKNIPKLGLSQEQGLARLNGIVEKLDASQKQLQKYISIKNFVQNASKKSVDFLGQSLTGAGVGAVVGGVIGGSTSAEPGDTQGALYGASLGGTIGMAAPAAVSAVERMGESIRKATASIPIKPGDVINQPELFNKTQEIISGGKETSVPAPKKGEVTLVVDSGKPIPDSAPTMKQISDLVGGSNAPVDLTLNRKDVRYVSLVGEQGRTMGEIPRPERGDRPLDTFSSRQENIARSPSDSVVNWAYSPEHGMIYAEFPPTKNDSLGGKGISHYFYDKVSPEVGEAFKNSPNKEQFIRTKIESDPNIRAIGAAGTSAELQEAVKLYKANPSTPPEAPAAPVAEVTPTPSSPLSEVKQPVVEAPSVSEKPLAATPIAEEKPAPAASVADAPVSETPVAVPAPVVKEPKGYALSSYEKHAENAVPVKSGSASGEARGSSNLQRASYDPKTKELAIQFNGRSYYFQDVPTAQYDALINAHKNVPAVGGQALLDQAKSLGIDVDKKSKVSDKIISGDKEAIQELQGKVKSAGTYFNNNIRGKFKSKSYSETFEGVANKPELEVPEKPSALAVTPAPVEAVTKPLAAVEAPAAPVVAEKPAIAPVEASAPLTGKALADRAVELGLDIDAGRRNLIETGNSMVTKVTQDKVAKLEQGLPPKEPPAAAPAVKETPPEPPKAPAAKVEPKAEPKVESKVETAPAPVVKKPVTKAKGKALATLPPVEAQIVKTKAGTTAAPSAELNKKVSSLSTKKQLDAQKDYLIDAIAKLKEQAPEVPDIKDAKLKAEYENHLMDIRVYEGKGGAEGKRKVERAIAGINLILRDSGLPKLTIEVPGDGQFTVNNTKRSLASFEGAIAKKFGKGIDPFKSKSNVAVEKFSQLTQAQLDEYKIKRMTEEEAAALDIEMSANETPKKKSK